MRLALLVLAASTAPSCADPAVPENRMAVASAGALAPADGGSPATRADTLLRIPGARRVLPLGRSAGGGTLDFAVHRHDAAATRATRRHRIEVVSGGDGATLRTLWSAAWPCQGSAERPWDAGGDADGDGTGDSVAFVGDLDGDGCSDYTVGGVQLDPQPEAFDEREVATYSSVWSPAGGTSSYVELRDGTRVELAAYHQARLSRRSRRPGYVSARSGRDGSELWRVVGALAGHAFGARVATLGDVDGDGVAEVLVQCDTRSTRAGCSALRSERSPARTSAHALRPGGRGRRLRRRRCARRVRRRGAGRRHAALARGARRIARARPKDRGARLPRLVWRLRDDRLGRRPRRRRLRRIGRRRAPTSTSRMRASRLATASRCRTSTSPG